MTITSKTKLILLWLLTLIGMILHFNYEVSGIFYGIDLTRPNTTGQESGSLLIIRTLFYHLPFAWILLIAYTNNKLVDFFLFVISVLYLVAHGFHFAGELSKEEKNFSQLSLLFVVFIVVIFLTIEHYNFYKTWVQRKSPEQN